MEDNEQLLRQFFSEAAHQQIADEGFSTRVMQRLPADTGRFVRWWNVACILLFAILFVLVRGWELVAVQLEVMLRLLATQTVSINVAMLFAVVFGLLFVGVGEALLRERVVSGQTGRR